MKKMLTGLFFIYFISCGSMVVPMSKIRAFVKELYRNGQVRTLLIPSPDEQSTKKLKDNFFMQQELQHFFLLLERELLRMHLEIDFDDFVEED